MSVRRPTLFLRASWSLALLSLFAACADSDGDPADYTGFEAGASPPAAEASVPTPDAGQLGNPPPDASQLPFDAGMQPPVTGDRDSGPSSVVDSAAPRPDGGGTGGTGDAGGGKPPSGKMSAGCGKTGSPMSGMYNIDVGGTQRMYIIKLPTGYDANKPYKLVFTWHYLGGSASGIARNYYGLEAMAQGSAIFVSPEGIDAGWSNSGGRDVAFAKAMVDKFKADYCIDEGRVFSTGFSYGGIMSNTVGCAMGDVFRAIAPMAGSGPRGGRCVGQVAAWITHGSADPTVSFASGQASRDHWRMTNHCTTETEPVGTNGCVSYKGCDPGYPLIWCQTTATHTQPRFAPQETWAFFSQF
jgi:polyhydroxybutyrate depolymerase